MQGRLGHLVVGLAQAFDCQSRSLRVVLTFRMKLSANASGRSQEGQLEEASQSYNPEVGYKHRTTLCNNYPVLSEKRSNGTWLCAQCL